MKTLITIGRDTYLTAETDLAKLLTLCKSLTPVSEQVIYGPGEKTETRYDEELGYQRLQVQAEHPERLRIEVVADEEIVTRAEFERRHAAIQERHEAWQKQQAALPVAV